MTFAARIAGLAVLGTLSCAAPAFAAANLVVNGDFELATLSGSNEFGSRYSSNQLTGWTTSGYNFLFRSGAADTTGATGEYGNLQLWGPNNGSANGLTAASPAGGAYVAADGAFGTDAISQTITGLTVGANYLLTFYWAAAQQQSYDGPTTESWGVTFGASTYNTVTVSTPNHGFTPWRQETVVFRATSTSQVLSFLAAGAPSGVPPFSLLDGVSLVAAPEPATWGMIVVGLTGIAFVGWRRRTPRALAATPA